MRSLLDVLAINAYRADQVCLYVRIIQLENRWTDLDYILCGHYAIWISFKFPTISNNNMGDEQTCDLRSTLAPLAVGLYIDIWYRFSENTELWYSNSLHNAK
jgi:hypothetical protein